MFSLLMHQLLIFVGSTGVSPYRRFGRATLCGAVESFPINAALRGVFVLTVLTHRINFSSARHSLALPYKK